MTKKGIVILFVSIIAALVIAGGGFTTLVFTGKIGNGGNNGDNADTTYYEVRIMGGKDGKTTQSTMIAGGEKQPSYFTYNRTPVMGYKFTGLFTAATGGDQVTDADDNLLLVIEKNMTLYERWEAKTYTVRFHVEDGWDKVHNISVATGDKINLPQVTEPAGRSFVGWANADGTLLSDGDEMKDKFYRLNFDLPEYSSAVNEESETIDLYLVSEVKKLNLTFYVNGQVFTRKIEYGQKVSSLDLNDLEIIVTDSGLYFCGWSMYENSEEEYKNSVFSNLSLFPIAKSAVTVSFYELEGGVAKTVKYPEFAQIDMYVPVRPGYEFLGWYDSPLYNRQPIESATVTGNNTYYAKWEKTNYVISFNCSTAVYDDIIYSYGESFELPQPEPATDRLVFVGWCEKADCTDTPITKITSTTYGNKTLYAKFIPVKEVTVTLVSTGSREEKIVQYGKAYNLGVPTREHYEFVGWFDGEDESAIQLTDNRGYSLASFGYIKNITVYARWQPAKYTITFITNGGSKVESVVYEYGTIPSRPQDPTNGEQTLFGWFTDSACTNEYFFNAPLTSNLTIYAKYHTSTAVSTAEQLVAIKNYPTANYHLTNDINLNDAFWSPIAEFSGILDGRGYKINNFVLSNTSGETDANFAFIRKNKGTLKNITFENVIASIKNNQTFDNASGVVTAINDGTIQNCYIKKSSVTLNTNISYGAATKDGTNFGGFCGVNNATVTNCTVYDLTINSNAQINNVSGRLNVEISVGGVCGQNFGKISYCSTYAVINGVENISSVNYCWLGHNIGGIIGYNKFTGEGSYLYSDADIQLSSSTDCAASPKCGGLIGINLGRLENSYSNAKVSAVVVKGTNTYTYVGGLVGVNASRNGETGRINNCYYDDLGEVRLKCKRRTAGAVGHNEGEITNCYANVTIDEVSAKESGAFVGYCNTTSNITNCFVNAKTLSGKAITTYGYGMFVGVYGGLLANSYYVSDVAASGQKGVNKTLSEILTPEFIYYTLCWDKNVWSVTAGQFPTLK